MEREVGFWNIATLLKITHRSLSPNPTSCRPQCSPDYSPLLHYLSHRRRAYASGETCRHSILGSSEELEAGGNLFRMPSLPVQRQRHWLRRRRCGMHRALQKRLGGGGERVCLTGLRCAFPPSQQCPRFRSHDTWAPLGLQPLLPPRRFRSTKRSARPLCGRRGLALRVNRQGPLPTGFAGPIPLSEELDSSLLSSLAIDLRIAPPR
ncbi:hypothetical protein BKA70DRAFT_1358713 [Coprinopsis sp. MPI-PUGE-AT-0042]|nr:hypothetical protein BKA70DRAFT_1358713 [Coprinopsis sp. MPI-PUGE-AT-0042]